MKLRKRLDHAIGKARSRVVKHLYRDTAGGPERAILIAGVARSGTTWLAELLSSQVPARIMFEPFNPRCVKPYRAFEYVQYMRPGQRDEALERFTADVFSGRIRDPRWIDRMTSVLRPDYRIVKAVRACLMLRWIHDRFPVTPTFLIVRHPCAVVASFEKLGWSARPDLESMERQRDLVEDHLSDLTELMASCKLPHQQATLLWCISNRVALRQCAGSGVLRLHYEDLLQHPGQEIPRIFGAIGRDFDDTVYTTLRRPSRTTKLAAVDAPSETEEPSWRRALGSSRADDVLEIVARVGLGHLYDENAAPTGTLHAGA